MVIPANDMMFAWMSTIPSFRRTNIIRNENRRWRMKLRLFSTPQAWFTAELIALKTPSEA